LSCYKEIGVYVNEYILIADIAKKRDYFALMLFHVNVQLEDGNKTLGTPDRVINYYDIKKIEQYQGLDYEEMTDRIVIMMQNPNLRLNTDLLVDGTGVGDAVVELIRKKGLYPISIVFSGGNTSKEHYTEFGNIFNSSKGSFRLTKILDHISVPKKDLVDSGKIMLQQGRLRLAPGKWNEEFKKQFLKFKGKINDKTKNVKYEAETEQDHDDLVICFLMGSWWILNRKEKGIKDQIREDKDSTGWEPLDYC
jgi:hypothetical protein